MYENDFRLYRGVVATSPDELYHHGVKGQKRGVRNGPPYPLRRGQASAAEKRAGWKSVVDTAEAVKKGTKKAGGGVKSAVEKIRSGIESRRTARKEKRVEKVLNAEEVKNKKVRKKKFNKAVREASDESLNKRIKRFETEEKYKKAVEEYHKKTSGNDATKEALIKHGKKLTSDILFSIGSKVVVPMATGYAVYKLKQRAFNKLTDEQRDLITDSIDKTTGERKYKSGYVPNFMTEVFKAVNEKKK